MTEPFELELRCGLPDALRTLVEEYPRDIWETHNHFDGLVRFWLERHAMFRKLLKMLKEDTNSLDEGQLAITEYQPRLQRFGSIFVNELHTHHHIEDHQYFPKLIEMERSLSRGFEILDKDHNALDGHLSAFAKDANQLLQARPLQGSEAIDRMQNRTEDLQTFLNRHLTDEEELVVPIILKHGFGM